MAQVLQMLRIAAIWPVLGLFMALAAAAQEAAWVQIEARSTRAEAEMAARDWARDFPDVAAFSLPSGWYAVALGPQTRAEAEARLRLLRSARVVPSDSFIATPDDLGEPIWQEARTVPGGPIEMAPLAPLGEAGAPGSPDAAPDAPVAGPVAGPVTARDIQRALAWEGLYTGAIDGAIGPASRAAIARYQQQRGAAPSGQLSAAEAAELVGAYRAAMAALGFESVLFDRAGLRADLPLGLVEFVDYAAPFVTFRPVGGSDVQLALISQLGGAETLGALREKVAALEKMPPGTTGPLLADRFELSGQGGGRLAYAEARLSDGAVKGFVLSWPDTRAPEEMTRVLETLRAGLTPIAGRALDIADIPLAPEARADMVSGLDLRVPRFTRSGVFVDDAGHVLTAAEGLAGCARLTVGADAVPTRLLAESPSMGMALLAPVRRLAPAAQAHLRLAPVLPGTPLALAGFPFGLALDAPALTRGTIEAPLAPTNGAPETRLLALPALAGDIGGPVLDESGALTGLLLPAPASLLRALPEGVHPAASPDAIADFLAASGLGLPPPPATGRLEAPALARRAAQIAVAVACWAE